MIVTKKVKVPWFDLACDFPYYDLYKALKKLYLKTNRKIFVICESVNFKEDFRLDGMFGRRGTLTGKEIKLVYDNLIDKQISMILKKYGV